MPAKTLGPEERWIVRSHINWAGEQNKTSPSYQKCFKNLEGPRKGVDWGISHRLEKGTSASKDARPRRG